MARGRRRTLTAIGVVIVVLALGLIVHRTFAPRDTVRAARGPYPPLPAVSAEVYGALLHFPLIVDGRLRLYAGTHEVWVDQPATKKSSLTPYWSLRRWPGEVLGVVVVGRTVVSHWNDGQVFGTDARSGRLLWHTATGVGRGGQYSGRRTGAGTVTEPGYLATVAGDTVVVYAPHAGILALDAATGTRRWRTDRDCDRGDLFTTADLVVCPAGGAARTALAWDAHTGDELAPGPVLGLSVPVGCGLARSDCRAVRGIGAALVGPRGVETDAPALADRSTVLAGDVAVRQNPDGSLAGMTLAGTPLWQWAEPPPEDAMRPIEAGTSGPELIAVDGIRLYVLTPDRDLVTVDATDGKELSRFTLLEPDHRAFQVGHVYAAGGFVAIERLRPTARPGDADPAYYFPNPGVLLAGS